MNTLCLENYGVSQMETREMKTVEGGHPILIGVAIGAAIEIISNWDNFKNGLKAGLGIA